MGYHDRNPLSVSLIARHGGDRFLLDILGTLYESLQEQADFAVKSKLPSNALSKEESAELAKEKVSSHYSISFGCFALFCL